MIISLRDDSNLEGWVHFHEASSILVREVLQLYFVAELLSALFENLLRDGVSEVFVDSLFELVDGLRGKYLILLHEALYEYGNRESSISG